jgi:hypothetical protein
MEASKGIAAATAQAPATFGASLALIPLIKASAALSIGTVLAQAIPKFDKGTERTPDTYIAGEKRPEIRVDKSGKVSVVDKPTLFTNDAGSKIIGGADTAALMDDVSNYTTRQIINNESKSDNKLVAGLISKMIKEQRDGNDKIVTALKRRGVKVSQIDQMRTDELRNRLRN